MKPGFYLWLLLFLLKSIIISAQTCDSMPICDCAAKDLSPAGIMLGHEHGKSTWKISYRFMDMMAQGNLSGAEKVSDNYVFNNYLMSPQNMQMNMHMLMGMYGFSNRFSVMVMFNYNTASMSMSMLPGTMHMHGSGTSMTMESNSTEMHSKTSGFADTRLYAVYALLNRKIHHVIFSEGFNIPSGSIQNKGKSDDPMYPGQRFPYMMQTSSGTLDFMPGLTYLLKKDKTSLSAQITSVIRPFYNSLNYHLGNEATFNCWGAYQFFPWISTSLRLEGNYAEVISGKDRALFEIMEPGANTINYGGKTVNSFVGLNFYLTKGFFKNNKFSFEYGMPLYQNVNGIQLAAKSTLYAGWLISF